MRCVFYKENFLLLGAYCADIHPLANIADPLPFFLLVHKNGFVLRSITDRGLSSQQIARWFR